MMNTIRLSSYSPRLNLIVFFTLLLIIGFLLFKLHDSSTKSTSNRITIATNENSKTASKLDSHSDANQLPTFSSYICDQHSSILYPYCFKVPVPVNGWTHAEKYNETDIGFLIYPDSFFNHIKTTAVRDTWLSRVTHKYFLNEKSYSWLPITIIDGLDDDRISNIERIFYGLKTIYNQQERSLNSHKWYYIGSCDTFINIHHVLKKLDSYDYTKSFFLGSSFNSTICLDSNEQKHEIEYPSSNKGIFISSKLVSLMIPHLTNYTESQNISDCSDIALTCLIYKLGIQLTNLSGYWTPHSLELNEQDEVKFDPEPNNFHSISSDQMYELDEFYSFLHIDRLINDKNWNELTDYIRTFISSHYKTLKIKRNECTLSAINTSTYSSSVP